MKRSRFASSFCSLLQLLKPLEALIISRVTPSTQEYIIMSFPGRAVQRAWHLVDASSQTVGRLATQIAPILKGKHKPTYRPNGDCGDYVVVVNADKVKFTGNKWDGKLYRWHTGYPGGLKQRKAKDMLQRRPEQILKKAVLGMMRRTNLRHKYVEPRLKIYAGPTHPHPAQLPPHVEPLPRHPIQRNGTFHFGLKYYAAPGTYQEKFTPNKP